jgi:hypothetical protein
MGGVGGGIREDSPYPDWAATYRQPSGFATYRNYRSLIITFLTVYDV